MNGNANANATSQELYGNCSCVKVYMRYVVLFGVCFSFKKGQHTLTLFLGCFFFTPYLSQQIEEWNIDITRSDRKTSVRNKWRTYWCKSFQKSYPIHITLIVGVNPWMVDTLSLWKNHNLHDSFISASCNLPKNNESNHCIDKSQTSEQENRDGCLLLLANRSIPGFTTIRLIEFAAVPLKPDDER